MARDADRFIAAYIKHPPSRSKRLPILCHRPGDFHAQSEPGARGEIDERVEAELSDAAAQEVVEAGLRNR
jgi:hypothetical protein